VDPGHQGGGVGSLLLTACEDEAIVRGCLRITLEVRPDNVSAIAFYRRRGFDTVGAKDDFYSDGSPALAMAKLLPARAAQPGLRR
ncbi:MAG: GNAT family N-acetyltransferase, partial [SAR202 cluster bacterium]|nr:GNAT family N-acetyltransferase [SAR202 cluster bacterium]